MFCEKCGNEIVGEAAFCPKCGAKLEIGESAEAKEQNAPGSEAASSIKEAGLSDVSGQATGTNKKPIFKKWWFWCIVIALLTIAIASFSSDDEKADDTSTESSEVSAEGDEAVADENEDKVKEASAADIYLWLAETDSFEYSIPEKSLSFIKEHPEFFPGSDENDGAMSDHADWEADYAHVAKSPDKYCDKLIGGLQYYVIDCEEKETEYGTITYLQLEAGGGDNYCVYYLGALDDVFEGDGVSGYILPFGIVTFENLGGAYTEAVIGAACYITNLDGSYPDEFYEDYDYSY